MNVFFEYLYKYGLHDCKLDEIVCKNEKIAFIFNSGIYELNSSGKEINLTQSCEMLLEINESDANKIYNHIEINQILKRKIYNIDFDKLISIVKKSKMDIEINYYSFFCNTILIKGYINSSYHEIVISDIKNIEFKFNGD